MTTLSERERSLEELFRHDQENQFKAGVKANKQFGLWVARQMELPEDAVEDYATGYIHLQLEGLTTQEVIAKAIQDIGKSGAEVHPLLVEQAYHTAYREAFQEVHG